MTANDYFKARAQWLVAVEASFIRDMIGCENHPEDQAHLDRTDEAAKAVLKAITKTPTTSIEEITARAVVLSCIINEFGGGEEYGDYEEFWRPLSARIAADLQNLAVLSKASSATDASTSASEAIRCAA